MEEEELVSEDCRSDSSLKVVGAATMPADVAMVLACGLGFRFTVGGVKTREAVGRFTEGSPRAWWE